MTSRPYAERVWRRDGSINFMSLTTAAENLKQNATEKWLRNRSVASIQKMLERGDILATAHAAFRRAPRTEST